MSESPSSTSEKPPIQNPGLGLFVADSTNSDPINSTPQITEIQQPESSENAPDGESDLLMAEVLEETAARDEEVEFQNAIERDICRVTIEQAEIEGSRVRLGTVDEGLEDDFGAVKIGGGGEEKDRKDSESVGDENENENVESDEENDGNEAIKSGDGATKFGRYNQNNNRRRVNYPMRPDAEDCAYYMKFGSCKFGLNCKFNHPPRRKNQVVKERVNYREENSERAGQTECKYYLTSGGCKYGKDCKYSHGSDKSSTAQISEFNFLGLPIRMGEKECPYYMRTGSCKYGFNCRFHHPEPVTIAGGDSPSGYGNGASLPSQLVSSSSASSWSSPRAYNEASPFVPVMFPPSQAAPTSNQDWNGYQAASYPTSERSLPTPPAFSMNNLPTDINVPMHQHDVLVEEYPERPGEPECSFFMKTGDCKFRSNCKFHHPRSRMSKAKANSNSNSYALNDKGLPLRPDQPICTHYHRYGICKYGPACKYNHPSNFGITLALLEEPAFGNSRINGAV